MMQSTQISKTQTGFFTAIPGKGTVAVATSNTKENEMVVTNSPVHIPSDNEEEDSDFLPDLE